MKRLALILLLLAPVDVMAQGQQITAGPFPNSGLLYVCPVPSGGTPCPSPVSIFSNITLTTGIGNPIVVFAQQTYTFYAAGGQYTLEMPASGVQQIVGGYSGANATSIDLVSQFGVKPDGIMLIDVASTTGQAAISSNAANWTQADVGKTVAGLWPTGACVTFGTQSSAVNQASTGTAANPTILSVQGPHNATLSVNVTTGGANMCLEYGTDNETQMLAADTFINGLTAASQCPAVLVPRGDILIDSPHFFRQPTPCANNPDVSGGTVIGGGMQVQGFGPGASRFVFTPSFWFNLANTSTFCKNGSSATACWDMVPNAQWTNIEFTGLGESRTGITDQTRVLVMGESYAILNNVRCTQAGWNDSGVLYGFYGLPIATGSTGGELYFHQAGNDGCGSNAGNNGIGGSFLGSVYMDHSSMQSACGVGYVGAGVAGVTFESTDNQFMSRNQTCSPSGFQVFRNVGGMIHSKRDTFMSEAGTTSNIMFHNTVSGAIAYLEDDHVGISNSNVINNNATNSIGLQNDAGTITYLRHTHIYGGAGGAGSISNAGTIFDEGGNTFNCTAACTFGTIIPVNGGSHANSVPIASRNTTLTSQNLLGWFDYAGAVHTTTQYPGSATAFVNASQSVVGVGCSTNTTVTWVLNWTDRTATAQSVTLGTQTVTTNGTVGGSPLNVTQKIDFNFGSTIQVTATVAPGTCTTVPSFSATAGLS